MSIHDDRIYFDPKNNKIYVAGTDVKWGSGPWEVFARGEGKIKSFKKGWAQIPKHWVLISREREKSLA